MPDPSRHARAEQIAKEIIDDVLYHSDPEIAVKKITETLVAEAQAAAQAQREADAKVAEDEPDAIDWTHGPSENVLSHAKKIA